MDLYKIETGNFMLDGGAMFGVIPKELWAPKYPCNEKNLCNISMRSLLVVNDDRRILIDTGMGDIHDEKFMSYQYLNGDDTLEKSIHAAGFTMDDITDVILTHLHYDHCCGIVKHDSHKQFMLTFKNATIWVSRQQWEWAIHPNERETAAFNQEVFDFMLKSGKLKMIEHEQMLYPGVEIRIFKGHTRGLVVPVIHYKNRQLWYPSDLIPMMASVPLVWIAAYDIFPLDSIAEKKAVLEEASDHDYVMFYQHDLYTECSTVMRTKRGFREKEAFTLEEFCKKS